jgi:hypothetical protein
LIPVNANKGETVKAPGTLQPFLIIPTIWKNISMDFIFGLPKSRNNFFIMLVVDYLCKYAHFGALQHPFKTSTMAKIFMHNIVKIHGMSHSIFYDHDPTFTNTF